MDTTKILTLKEKVKSEAEKALLDIYTKYSKEMNEVISEALPSGTTLTSVNGLNTLVDSNYREIESARAWGASGPSGSGAGILLADLQYPEEFYQGFYLDFEIKSSK